MKVILLEDVKGQGKKGQMIEASDGYARNYLIPRKLAQLATPGAVSAMKIADEAARRKAEAEKKQADELAARLNAIEVIVRAKAGEGGRLFGAVTTKEISDELLAQHGIEVNKSKITLDEHIKAFGKYEVKCKLYAGVSGVIHVVVTEAK